MGLSLKKMFQEIFFFITLYPPESESEPGAGAGARAGARAAEIEEPGAGAAKNGRLRNTGSTERNAGTWYRYLGFDSIDVVYVETFVDLCPTVCIELEPVLVGADYFSCSRLR